MRVLNLHDAFASVVPPQWLVHGVMAESCINLLTGEVHASKTFLALEMALAVATGSPFLGHFPSREGTALYVAADSPDWDVVGQLRLLLEGRGLSALPPERLLLGLDVGHALGDDASAVTLGEACRKYEVNFLVLDTLKALHDAPENDAQEMGRVMRRVKFLRDTGQDNAMGILVLHHVGKPGQEYRSALQRIRGSSVIAGDVDGHLHLNPNKKTGIVRVEIEKRRAIDTDNFAYDFQWDKESATLEYAKPHENWPLLAEAVAWGQTHAELKTAELLAWALRDDPAGGDGAARKRADRVMRHMRSAGQLRKVRHGTYAFVGMGPDGGGH